MGRKLSDLFTSKAAALALAGSLALGAAGGALAQDSTPQAQSAPTKTSLHIDMGNPHLPYEAIAGLGGVAAMLALYGMARRSPGGALRLCAAFTLSAAMLNPQILVESRNGLPTEVALVVDRSASQSIGGRDAMTEKMRKGLEARLSSISGLKVRMIEAGGPQETNLGSAIESGIADIPQSQLGAVIVLTDGLTHDEIGGVPGNAPLHVLLSGRENEADRRIVLEKPPLFGVAGEEMNIAFRVLDEGVPSLGGGEKIEISLSVNGKNIGSISAMPGETKTLKLPSLSAGKTVIGLEVPALDHELSVANNRALFEIAGIQDNLRVLLATGTPNRAAKMWRTLLQADPAVELVHLSVLRPQKKMDDTPLSELSLTGLPVDKLFLEDLGKFDLVIFDQWHRQGILGDHHLESVARYVENGGAVLVIGGPMEATEMGLHGSPLGSILPAKPDGRLAEGFFKLKPSETGLRHPVVRDLEGARDNPPSWGRWLNRIEAGMNPAAGESSANAGKGPVENDASTIVVIRKNADSGKENSRAGAKESPVAVMETADGKPLIVLSREGEGRIAQILSPDLWLWARGYDGGGPYREMLKNLAHWLMKEPALEEESLRLETAKDGGLVIERQSLKDFSGPVTLKMPSGKELDVTLEKADGRPGLWRARVDAREPGVYIAEQGEHLAFARGQAGSGKEFETIRSTGERFSDAARRTGGLLARMEKADSPGDIDLPRIKPIEAGDGDALSGKGWLGIRMTRASTVQGVERVPLFAGLSGLSALLLLYAMWGREGGVEMPGRDLFKNGRGGPKLK